METISDAVHHLPEILGGPTILLGESVTIVDTGVPGSAEEILAAVESLGRARSDVGAIVLTHADGDHVGSLAALVEATGADVWAGEHEADVIEGKAAGRGGDIRSTSAASTGASRRASPCRSTAGSRPTTRAGTRPATCRSTSPAAGSSSPATA